MTNDPNTTLSLLVSEAEAPEETVTEEIPSPAPEEAKPIPSQAKHSAIPLLDYRESRFAVHIDVLLALLPLLIWSVYLYGLRPLTLVTVAIGTSLAVELICRRLFCRVAPLDLAPIITGLLIALGMPASVPLWIPAIGALIAILPIRQLFGGTGRNLINPAAFALLCLHLTFPQWMRVLPATGQRLPAFALELSHFELADTSALDTLLGGILPDPTVGSLFFGLRAGAIGEMSAFLLIAGGLYLAWRRILRLSLPILCVLTLGVLVYLEPTLAAVSDVVAIRSAFYHILGSNTLLVAIYLLGDPVTTPKSSRGAMVAGILAGAVIFYVRRDIDPAISALAAVPVVNLTAPLLDRFLMPPVFGGRRKTSPTTKTASPSEKTFEPPTTEETAP